MLLPRGVIFSIIGPTFSHLLSKTEHDFILVNLVADLLYPGPGTALRGSLHGRNIDLVIF